MAGHSKYHNIKHRKAAQDKKRAKLFTRISKEIEVAARFGDNPDINPRLRNAIVSARSVNLPKEKIQTAVKKASSSDKTNYEELRYEGYGSSGIAFIVEVFTDNKNRSASAVRSTFSKYGGSLGETGSVSFMFDHVGVIEYECEGLDEEKIFDTAIELDALSIDTKNDEYYEIITTIENFITIRDGLIDVFGNPNYASLAFKPNILTELDLEKSEKILKLIDVLEDNDDVSNVYHNALITDDIIESLGNE